MATDKGTIIRHLEEVIDKIDRNHRDYHEGFYDDYDGKDNKGAAEFRNTVDLLDSLEHVLEFIRARARA